jgi:hypothetical protein
MILGFSFQQLQQAPTEKKQFPTKSKELPKK